MHTVMQQVEAGAEHGLDWMVITDHGHAAHEKYAVEQTYADVGSFDWMTAKVGGMWDSMLAEGKGWWMSRSTRRTV